MANTHGHVPVDIGHSFYRLPASAPLPAFAKLRVKVAYNYLSIHNLLLIFERILLIRSILLYLLRLIDNAITISVLLHTPLMIFIESILTAQRAALSRPAQCHKR